MTLCKYIVFIFQGSKDCIWEEVNKDLWRKELSIYEPLGVYTKCLKSGEGVGVDCRGGGVGGLVVV